MADTNNSFYDSDESSEDNRNQSDDSIGKSSKKHITERRSSGTTSSDVSFETDTSQRPSKHTEHQTDSLKVEQLNHVEPPHSNVDNDLNRSNGQNSSNNLHESNAPDNQMKNRVQTDSDSDHSFIRSSHHPLSKPDPQNLKPDVENNEPNPKYDDDYETNPSTSSSSKKSSIKSKSVHQIVDAQNNQLSKTIDLPLLVPSSEKIIEIVKPEEPSTESSKKSNTHHQILPNPIIEDREKTTSSVPPDLPNLNSYVSPTVASKVTPSNTITSGNENLDTVNDVSLETVRRFPIPKSLFEQEIQSLLPIISFCQPFSMTSRGNDVILSMPRHLMIMTNQNSVTIYPWEQSVRSTSTILECVWCDHLNKLLVTTLEDDRIFIYDFASIIDSIKLRGRSLSVKYKTPYGKNTNSSVLLPTMSHYRPIPFVCSRTRFTKSNSLGIYYCYISGIQNTCMLARIDHNERKCIKSIDCTGGSLDDGARVCAVALSDDQVAVVLTNLAFTLYDGKTLAGLKQYDMSKFHFCRIRGISSLVYLWKTWLIFDPVVNQVVGFGSRKRRFVKNLIEQPIHGCSMENNTLAVWLGYPGAVVYYQIKENIY